MNTSKLQEEPLDLHREHPALKASLFVPTATSSPPPPSGLWDSNSNMHSETRFTNQIKSASENTVTIIPP